MSVELIVDNFAGGGGASLGIERAVGRAVDIAVNHDESAIEMHTANHPWTRHFREDVWKVDPVKVCKGRPVGLAWFSPDCKHFSRAKGGKPVSPRVRGLAWVAVRWAREVGPRVIMLENVREFREWGPLIPKVGADGKPVLDLHGNPQLIPDPDRKGHSFKRFVGSIRNLGYVVEWRDLDAADFGAPTHRRRLFLIARNDGESIVWPEPTHGPGRAHAYRTAAECIDWSLPCPSIFERKRPLVANTMRRIAHGFVRYVLKNAEPFIVTCNHAGEGFRGHGVGEPMKTVTGSRDAHGLVTPYVVRIGQTGGKGKSCNDAREPLTTVTTKAEHLIVTPYLVPHHGERAGQQPRAHNAAEPMPVIAPNNHASLIVPWVVKHYGGVVGASIERPLPTTTQRGTQNQCAAAYLVHLNRGVKQWSAADEPMRTVTAGGYHAAEVRAFLVKYYGSERDGQSLAAPLGTVTGNDRFGLVTVTIGGEPYVVVDIGMRMLTPRELARAQGFPDSYVLTGSQSAQVARIGNSVCPVMSEVLARANYAGRVGKKRRVA